MSIRLIAVDMDGTFLNDQNEFNRRRFQKLLPKLAAKNIKFAVASGSQYQRLRNKFTDIDAEIFFISQNGSVVHDGDEFLAATPIDDKLIQDVFELIREYPAGYISQVIVSGIEKTYVASGTPVEVQAMIAEYFSDLETVDNLSAISSVSVGEGLTKIGVRFSSKTPNLDQVIADFRAKLPTELASLNSGFNVELVGMSHINKATGIKMIQDKYDIAANEIVTFGDNENDIAMLALTPHSYAMENAHDKVKTVAHHIAPTNNEEGVLTVIEQLISTGL